MESVNFTDTGTPSPTTNKGRQTPPDDAATAIKSSPLPDRSRSRQGSVARKRTNEEMYQPIETPKASPKAARFLQRSATIAAVPESEGQHARNNPFERPTENAQTRATAAGSAANAPFLSLDNSFVKEIHDYQQQLEFQFQDFERSLNERDPSVNLDEMDWDDLEARYTQEIQPFIAAEKEIMDEFSDRFAQFLLYMHVSNDHEAERAVKRLRTRVALAQNSEGLLAQKQAHYAKVLEAFQSAMALLGNV